MKLITIFFALMGLSFMARAYNINPQKISVSGISSGAFIAHQMHLAYADEITGAALIAGGPFNCSEGNVTRAISACMNTSPGAISVDKIINTITDLRKNNLIDQGLNLSASKVFLISGTNDEVVARPVVQSVRDLYLKLQVPEENIKYVTQLEVGHAFPTLDYGNPCATGKASPFMSRCNYDGAFEILNFIYGPLNPKVTDLPQNLKFISQAKYFSQVFTNSLFFLNAPTPSMADQAALYVPTDCQNGAECALHISFHGCLQSQDEIGDAYYQKTGFNAWAEANDIIVLYPQAEKNLLGGNPNSCWDWWGYTGPQFMTKQSVQMNIVHKMIEDLKKR